MEGLERTFLDIDNPEKSDRMAEQLRAKRAKKKREPLPSESASLCYFLRSSKAPKCLAMLFRKIFEGASGVIMLFFKILRQASAFLDYLKYRLPLY